MKTAFSALLPLLLLAACTSVDDPFLRTGALQESTLSTPASRPHALAALPGRTPTDMRETSVAGGIEQTVLYPNATDLAGENSLSVTFATAGAADMTAPTRAAIAADMRKAIPDVAMTIAPDIRDNAYGVFGFATGSPGGSVACLYAWQTIRHIPAGTLENLPDLHGATAVRIRLRYCDPTASAESLAALMQGLRIGSGPVLVQPAAMPPAVAPVVVNDRPAVKRVRASRPVVVEDASVPASPSVTVPLPGEPDKPAAAVETPATLPVATSAQTTVKIPLPGA